MFVHLSSFFFLNIWVQIDAEKKTWSYSVIIERGSPPTGQSVRCNLCGLRMRTACFPSREGRRRHTVASAYSGEQNSNLPPVNTGDKKKLVGHLMPCRAKRPPKTPQQVAIFSESAVSAIEV